MIKRLFIILFSFPIIGFGQCNGSLNLCDKQYNDIAYLTTHNAFNSDQDGFLFPNQTYNISSQLNSGVRALMIDVYDYMGVPTAYHSFFAFGTIPFFDLLDEIKWFLDNNPNEIITIILECYIGINQVEYSITHSGLNNYLYTYNDNQGWPTLQEMINNNTRLVVFSDVNEGGLNQQWYHYIWDYAVETHYSVNNINDFTCNYNRGDANNDLFIFNHFVTDGTLGYGLYIESNDVNSNPFFINRALTCQQTNNKFPNFITIDFFELGDGIDVVNQLNGIPNNVVNINNNLRRNLVSIKDIIGNETSARPNGVLFYIYDDGTIEKKVIIQ